MVVSSEGVASKERATRSPGSVERKPKGLRSKEGCLTCRIRRKKCDQGKHSDSCESCRRLHIECLGYSRNRPEWLKVWISVPVPLAPLTFGANTGRQSRRLQAHDQALLGGSVPSLTNLSPSYR
ncbi:hypothetical protein BDV93DRAFT_439650 [Ceratobasidium sp. AG-I]|nr:hypothetical protein BDV93DRAFT_439650 [Ceratobasidium sp. AG-I]